MDKLVIKGQNKLKGEVVISGAKNAAVAIIPAAIMANDVCIVENLPNIEDVKCLYATLDKMGVKCEFIDSHTMKIDSRSLENVSVTFDEVRKMRASYYLLGALLARYKKAEVAMPGGCNFGSRPIDLHLSGFAALGAEVEMKGEVVKVSAEKLTGASIYMDTVSVGATINIMLAATMAEGTTTIENAAKEPHVVDVANFLNSMGANIKGAGTDVIRIKGVPSLHRTEYSIIPDQIEAGTFMFAAAATCGDVLVKNIIPKHMEGASAKLMEMGCIVEEYDDAIRVIGRRPLKPTRVKTAPYPGFPTDMQPQIAVTLALADGTSMVTESIFENRFKYVDELARMGAKIKVEGNRAVVMGVEKYTGARVSAPDLRAGAALVIAGLAAEGITIIDDIQYVQRGYERFEQKMQGLGAKMERVDNVKDLQLFKYREG